MNSALRLAGLPHAIRRECVNSVVIACPQFVCGIAHPDISTHGRLVAAGGRRTVSDRV